MITTLISLACFATGMVVMKLITPEVKIAEELINQKISELRDDLNGLHNDAAEAVDNLHNRVSTLEGNIKTDEVAVETTATKDESIASTEVGSIVNEVKETI